MGGVLLLAGLMAVGVLGVREYLAGPPTAEATITVQDITRHVVAHFEETHALCPSASAPIPASTAAITGVKYIASAAEWKVDAPRGAGFACLKFEQYQPQYYQYDYRSDGRNFTITARGDLDADGELAVFSQRGRIEGAKLVLDPLDRTHPTE